MLNAECLGLIRVNQGNFILPEVRILFPDPGNRTAPLKNSPPQNEMDLLLFVLHFFRDQESLSFEGFFYGKISVTLFQPVFKIFPIHIHPEPVRCELPAVFSFAEADGIRIRHFDQEIDLD